LWCHLSSRWYLERPAEQAGPPPWRAWLKLATGLDIGRHLDPVIHRVEGRSHSIAVMPINRPVRDDRVMDPEAAVYTIRLNGHLGATTMSAFPALESRYLGAHTVLSGVLDRSSLYGVLAAIEALGLDLLELRRLETPGGRIGAR
jgi:hypothetical protein